MKHSNESIPNNLIELLRNVESFEVWFFNPNLNKESFNFESDYVDFQANLINKNVNGELRDLLISAFLNDAQKGGELSRCWIPHHGFRAINDQLIEIAICFMCGSFRGQILNERFYGTFPSEEESESKIIFDKIVAEQSIENK